MSDGDRGLGFSTELARVYDRLTGQLEWLLGQGIDAARLAEVVVARLRGEEVPPELRETARRNVVDRLAVLIGPRGLFLSATWAVSGPLRLAASSPEEVHPAEQLKALRRLELAAGPASPAHGSLRELLAEAAADIEDVWSEESLALGRRLEVYRGALASDAGRELLERIAEESAASAVASAAATTSTPQARELIARARRHVGGAGLDVAQTRLDPSKLALALADADAAVAASPEDVEALLVRGQVRALGGQDVALAERDLLRVVELDPAEGRAYTALANLARAAGDRSLAEARYAEALAAARPDPSAHFYRGVWRVEDGDAAGGEADGVAAIRGAPDRPGGYWILGRARFLRGDASGALESYGAALAADPDHAGTFLARSDVFVAAGQHARAIADLDRAVALSGDGTCFYNRGNAKLAAGELVGAESDFSAALMRNPRDVQAVLNRGTVRLMRGDAPAAEDDFRLATELAPTLPQAHSKLGLLLLHRGERQMAIAEIRTALAVAPPDWPPRAELVQLLATFV